MFCFLLENVYMIHTKFHPGTSDVVKSSCEVKLEGYCIYLVLNIYQYNKNK